MNGFFEYLPWNLSALGALVILATSVSVGVDLWISLERAGLGFVVFWIVGLVGRTILMSSGQPTAESQKKATSTPSEQKRSE